MSTSQPVKTVIPRTLVRTSLISWYCFFEVLGTETAGHAYRQAVIGKGTVLITALFAGAHHLENRAFPVRPFTVQVEIPPDIVEHDQIGELVLLCGLDLAAVFPQLGWHPIQTDRFEDVFFPGATDPLTFFDPDLLGLLSLRHAEDSVFADAQAAVDAKRANGYVVGLRAGKVMERRSVTTPGKNAEIHLQARPKNHGPAGCTGRDHPLDFRISLKALHDRFWTVRGGQNINVAYGLHAAAVASGHLELLDGTAIAQIFNQGTHQLVRVQEFEALGPFCQILNRLPDLFDTLLAESGQSLRLARVDPLLKLFH